MKQSLIAEITTLLSNAPIVKNLARKKFLALFVIALAQSRKVQFCSVAQHFNDQAKTGSNEVRIQDFFRQVDINYAAVAALLLSLLPRKQKLRLCIDRTEWDFGCQQVNILMVTVSYGEFTVPLYWELLDNRSGNSSAAQRIDLMELCVNLIGQERIGLVIGDREFVGLRWLKYLKDKGIHFVMRLPKHHKIGRPNGHQHAVEALYLKVGRAEMLRDCMVDGVVGHVWVMLQQDGDYLFLFGTPKVKFLGQLYQKRWCIEACFQNLKGRGFDLESTHLKDNSKLKKLIALVSITYAICGSLGIYYHQKIKPIATKNHGYKANSFARKGINLIQQWCRQNNKVPEKIINRLLAFIRYLQINNPFFKPIILVG